MTNEEHRKIVDAIIDAHKDNEMGGKYAKAFDHGVQSAFNRVCKALNDIKKQPSEDCISREAVLDGLANIAKAKAKSDAQKALMGRVMFFTEQLPPVTPQYTDEKIDKAQAVEQAYVDKMVELAVEESRREWLNSFDTSSATKCFEAVNILKERLEHEET